MKIKRLEQVINLLARVSLSCLSTDFTLIVDRDKRGKGKPNARVFIQIQYVAKCTKTDQELPWKGRKWYLSEFMTDSEIIFTAFEAFKAAINHELLEGFRIDSIILVNPHVNFEELLKVSHREVTRTPPSP